LPTLVRSTFVMGYRPCRCSAACDAALHASPRRRGGFATGIRIGRVGGPDRNVWKTQGGRMDYVTTREQLRSAYDATHDVAVRKVLHALDAHARRFIERSPFLLIGSQDAAGHGDVSPKGDFPGFVRVLDDRTLAIPDRPGNNRLDTWENILDNPGVGLLFMIPGMNETLRVNGEARLTLDAALCADLQVSGRPAQAVLVVKVREAYMHCAKAFIRSRLWSPDTWPPRSDMPTLGAILKDQARLRESAEAFDGILDEAYRTTLW
jgi:PPOX class probable FMN-dependent enzyme